MAFQSGSQIDPRLGRTDYSGFARAADIRRERMDMAASQIYSGIRDYAQKKEEKQIQEDRYSAIRSYLPEGKDGDNIAKLFSKDPEQFKTAYGLIQMQEDREKFNMAAIGADGDPDKFMSYYSELGGGDFELAMEYSNSLKESIEESKDPKVEGIPVPGTDYVASTIDGKFGGNLPKSAAPGEVGDKDIPTQTQADMLKKESIAEARRKYEEGDIKGAQLELIAAGVRRREGGIDYIPSPSEYFGPVQTKGGPDIKEFDPGKYTGSVISDDESGKSFKSTGDRWVEVPWDGEYPPGLPAPSDAEIRVYESKDGKYYIPKSSGFLNRETEWIDITEEYLKKKKEEEDKKDRAKKPGDDEYNSRIDEIRKFQYRYEKDSTEIPPGL